MIKSYQNSKAITLIALILLQTTIVFAKQISKSESLIIAQQFYLKQSASKGTNLKSANVLDFKLDFVCTDNLKLKSATVDTTQNSKAYYYIYNVGQNKGFVIVSGDDRVTPVLGYSDEGKFDYENMPEHVRLFMENYKIQIKAIIQRNDTTIAAWKKSATIEKIEKFVDPLIKTMWGQDSPYNSKICSDKGPIVAPTGCVATAMAQIMNYHKWPINGTSSNSYYLKGEKISANFGNTTYDWGNMLKKYWLNSDTASITSQAVATLMFHCGVSVNMKYDTKSSGAKFANIINALIDYFGYDKNVKYITSDRYTPNQWKYQMMLEIDAKRPVLINGYDNEAGHLYIADGYDKYDFIHLNWGWDGYYNGFFEIDPLDGSTYFVPTSMIIGIQKPLVSSEISLCYEGFGLKYNSSQSRNLPLTTSIKIIEENNKCYYREVGLAFYNNNVLYKTISTTTVNMNSHSTLEKTFKIFVPDTFPMGTYQLKPVFKSPSDTVWSEMKFKNRNQDSDSRKSEYIELVVSENNVVIFQNSKTMHCNKGDFRTNFSFTDWENIQRLVVSGEIDQWDLMYMASAKNIKTIDINDAKITDTKIDLNDLAYGTKPVNFAEYIENLDSYLKNLKNIFWFGQGDDNTKYSGSGFDRDYTSSQMDVVAIADQALIIFKKGMMPEVFAKSGVENILLPGNLKFIANKAFCNSPNLKSISLPDSIKIIGDSLFFDCTNLKEIKFPAYMEEIWSQGLGNLKNIEKITLPVNMRKIREHIFKGYEKLLNIKLPDSLRCIEAEAFSSCKNLKAINLPSMLDSIKNAAFNDCTGLTEILSYNAIPPTIIGTAFQNVPVSIPVHVPIGCKNLYLAANGWKSFTNIIDDLPAKISKMVNNPIAGKLFSHFSKHEKVTIVDLTITGTLDVSDFSFIRDSLSSITRLNLSEIKLARNKIPDKAFYKKESTKKLLLTELVLPDRLFSIGDSAFKNCSNLEKIDFPNNLTSIGDGAFEECNGITEYINSEGNCFNVVDGVVYNSDVTTLILYPAGKSSSTYIIPASVTTIGNSSFFGCTNLISVDLPANLTTIGINAFRESNKLKSIYLPALVTSIGEGAFAGCSGFEKITSINQTPPIIDGNYIFNGVPKDIEVKIPYGSGDKYRKALGWKDFTRINDDPIIKTVYDNVAGQLSTHFTTEEVALVNKLIITGDLKNSDFSFIKNNLKILTELDISGTKLTKIEAHTFSECTNLKAIKLPATLTSIDYDAFGGYSSNCGLTSIIIPPSVKSIGGGAFSYCEGLTSITIPASVSVIESSVFYSCLGLKQIKVDNPVPVDLTKSGQVFDGVNTSACILQVPSGSKSAYQAADKWKSFTHIVEGDFLSKSININAGQLSSVLTSSDNLKINKLKISGTIDARDFVVLRDSIAYLSELDLSGVKIVTYTGIGGTAGTNIITYKEDEIPQYAFYNPRTWKGSDFLSSVILPSSIASIEKSAFQSCTRLTSVNLPTSLIYIGEGAFSDCRGLPGNLTISQSVKTIGAYAFSRCSGLTGSLIIPSSVMSIGERAFEGCDGLSGNLTIPQSIKTIGAYAFSGCSRLTGELKIPSSVTLIEYGTFYCCSGLTGSLVIPSSVVSIGERAFEGCDGLSGNLTIPQSVKTIGAYAFSGCSGLTGSLVIPSSVVSIGEKAFNSCRNLISVSIPSSVISIESGAFISCANLTSVAIPSSVKSIKPGAFNSCTHIKSITIPSSVVSIGDGAFTNCSALINVNNENPYYSSINGVLFDKNQTTLIQCPISRTSVSIPKTVTMIHNNSAFYECYGLTSIRAFSSLPPDIYYYVFSHVDKTSCTLHVPFGSKSAYQTNFGWEDFKNIVDDLAIPAIVMSSSLKGAFSFNLATDSPSTSIQVDWGDGNIMDYSAGPVSTKIGHTNPTFENRDISIYGQGISSIDVRGKLLYELNTSNCISLENLYCSENNLMFKNLPQINTRFSNYQYVPQAALPIPKSVNKETTIDLSGQSGAEDINGIQRETTYVWKTKTGTALVEGIDYNVPEIGKFAFITIPTDSIYCEMSNTVFPDFKDKNIYKTTSTKITISTGMDDRLLTEAVLIYASGQTVYVQLPETLQNTRIVIYDMIGRLIISKRAENALTAIPINRNGFYVVRVEADNNIFKTEKIIIN